ncbi:MAG: hypothetical protein KY466_16565 [Gemmatimonadetes bacterium]|nr:hypothetical protein [Gemmatimonadota bacterium]
MEGITNMRITRSCYKALVIVLLGSAACAGVHPMRPQAPGGRNVLTEAELSSVGPISALEALRLHRPHLLIGRAPGHHRPRVYIDGMEYSLSGLAQLPAAHVVEIRYITALEATPLLGRSRGGGALLVSTRGWRAAIRGM